jgi:uncharacterized protein YlxW (UPF0749 family)
MDEKIKNLWNNNKIFFFLLLPIILIIVFKDLILAFLIGNARKVANEAKVEDEKLKAKADSANDEANKLKNESDNLEKDIKERDENDISEDWHKK